MDLGGVESDLVGRKVVRGEYNEGGTETVIAYPLCLGFLLSKTRGVGSLAAVRGDGGTEDRVGLCALRHYIIEGRSLRAGRLVSRRWRGFRGLRRLRGLRLRPGLPLLLRLLHVFDGGAEGALQ